MNVAEPTLRDLLRSYLTRQQEVYGGVMVERPTIVRAQTPSTIAREQTLFSDRLGVIEESWVEAPTLEGLQQLICTCQKCPLGATRTKFVFGVGNPNADIMVIGEAPGADEDASGEPFVGLAGQLLTKILSAIDLGRDDVYIANILKCRPPGNRKPEPAEVEQCEPYLLRQLELIKPKFILALGLTAATTLLGRSGRMGELRGKVHDYHGIGLIVTYHPAALLRNPQWKRPTWEDVQMLRRLYDESRTHAA